MIGTLVGQDAGANLCARRALASAAMMNTVETHVITVVDAALDDVDGKDLPLASANGAKQVVRASVFEDVN